MIIDCYEKLKDEPYFFGNPIYRVGLYFNRSVSAIKSILFDSNELIVENK